MTDDVTTLVLLPGLDGTGKLFAPFVSALPAELHPQVVAYPDKALRLNEYAQRVARRLPATPSVLLAESFSGLVALSLLAQHSSRIRGVIFCAAFAEPPRPFLLRLAPIVRCAGGATRAVPAFMLRQFCLGPNASAEQLAWLRKVLAEVSPGVLAHRLRLVAARHPFVHSHFDVPCCYLQPQSDRLVPVGAARWFEKHFASFRPESLAGPHFLAQAEPHQCAKRVAEIAATIGR